MKGAEVGMSCQIGERDILIKVRMQVFARAPDGNNFLPGRDGVQALIGVALQQMRCGVQEGVMHAQICVLLFHRLMHLAEKAGKFEIMNHMRGEHGHGFMVFVYLSSDLSQKSRSEIETAVDEGLGPAGIAGVDFIGIEEYRFSRRRGVDIAGAIKLIHTLFDQLNDESLIPMARENMGLVAGMEQFQALKFRQPANLSIC
jgi:hypothetical protein